MSAVKLAAEARRAKILARANKSGNTVSAVNGDDDDVRTMVKFATNIWVCRLPSLILIFCLKIKLINSAAKSEY